MVSSASSKNDCQHCIRPSSWFSIKYYDLVRLLIAWRLFVMLSAVFSAIVLSISIAVGVTNKHYVAEMTSVVEIKGSKFSKLLEQIDLAFENVSVSMSSTSRCDPVSLSPLFDAVKQYNYIYSAAVVLQTGQVCTSYGETLDSSVLPVPFAADHYKSKGGLDIWFRSSHGVNHNVGEVIVSKDDIYIWLNKGIIIGALSLPAWYSVDVVDSRNFKTIFSSDDSPGTYKGPIDIGRLIFDDEYIYLAEPGLHLNTLILVGISYIEYYKKLALYSFLYATLISTLAILLFAFMAQAHRCYFSEEAKFRNAFLNDELEVNYQPIVQVKTSRFLGAEALLRWTRHGRPISPDEFLPLAEAAGLMSSLTKWVCERVFSDYAGKIKSVGDFYITINLTSADLFDSSFPDFIKSLRVKYNVPACCIVFEITEGSVLEKDKAISQLQRISNEGHLIAIDDFGTGYSSLSYLQDLPVDIVKIDRSFMTPEKMNSTDAVWWHIVSIARSLELIVVAEGIENDDQIDCLLIAGVSAAGVVLFQSNLLRGTSGALQGVKSFEQLICLTAEGCTGVNR